MAKTMASLQAFPSSLLPRAWSCALVPFPFLASGMENMWSKFELPATFPLGATQSGDMKKYQIFYVSLGG